MPGKVVNVTRIDFQKVEDTTAVTAFGYLLINPGVRAQFEMILSPEDLAALELILESIDQTVRQSIGEAVQEVTTARWDSVRGSSPEQTRGEG